MQADNAFVSSYYGSGAFTLWLLIYVAVVITCCMNPRHYLLTKDNITNDFVAFLAYPAIASGHLLVQMARYPGSHRQLWTSSESEDELPRLQAFSIKQSVKICDIFICMCAWYCLLCMVLRYIAPDESIPRRRTALVGLVCLCCYIAEVRSGMHGSRFILWSFHIFTPFLLLASILLPLFNLYVICALAVFALGSAIICLFSLVLVVTSLVDRILEGRRQHGPSLPWIGISRIAPFFIASALFGYVVWSAGPELLRESLEVVLVPMEIVFPKTSTSLKDLDQATALLGGLCTVFFSIVAVLKEQGWIPQQPFWRRPSIDEEAHLISST